MDFPAVRTTELIGLNHKTIDNWYNYLREMIYLECEKEKLEMIYLECEKEKLEKL